ncbi:hypothetical protein KIPB_009222 [Kipferlia bialata]|uniref:Uncharacterized protein n=1 Tax=Kipferlia bialata TaxID=797122 RepID=A0A391NP03_9EUKA|nr:hypothetical protein KIPB_009222 [Kipferlia bialata]|eukprot:g9222.t1
MSLLLAPHSRCRALAERYRNAKLRECLRLIRGLNFEDNVSPANFRTSWEEVKCYIQNRVSGKPQYVRSVAKTYEFFISLVSDNTPLATACAVEGRVLAKIAARSSTPVRRAPLVSAAQMALVITRASSPYDIRLALISLLAYVRMARIDEIILLHRSDVSIDPSSVTIVTRAAKNRQAAPPMVHTIQSSSSPLDPRPLLIAWLALRDSWCDLSPESSLFGRWKAPSHTPSFDVPPVYDNVRSAISKAFDVDVTAHSFRRSSAAVAASQGTSDRDMMAWGGWASAEGMRPYVADAVRRSGSLSSILMPPL